MLRSWRRVHCPRCLRSLRRSDVFFADRSGDRIASPSRFRPANVQKWAIAIATGDDSVLLRRGRLELAEMYAKGLSAHCPGNDGQGSHPIPEQIFHEPTLVVGLVGPPSSGKTVYLACLIDALTNKNLLSRVYSSYEIHPLFVRDYNQEMGKFIKNGLVPTPTQPNVNSVSKPPIFLTPTRPGKVNLLLFDMSGELAMSAVDQAESERHAFSRDAAIFFVTPSSLTGVANRGPERRDQIQTQADCAEAMNAALHIFRELNPSAEEVAAAVVIAKSDDIAPGSLGLVDLLDDPPYQAEDITADDLLEGVAQESAMARTFLLHHGGDAFVDRPEEYFDEVSYHFVQSVRSAPQHANGGPVFPGGPEPRRVLDPLVSIFAQVGLLGSNRRRLIGLPW